jgi:uncharacterized protein (DUF58 family)
MMMNELRQAFQIGVEAGSHYSLLIPRESGSQGSGSRLGSRSGQSMDFRDYRDYQPGDDLRTVDWAAYARSDRLSVKLFHEEVSPHLDLVLDNSRSMALADSAKLQASAALAAMLVTAADNARFSMAVWRCHEDRLEKLHEDPARPLEWQSLAYDAEISIDEVLRLSPPKFRRRGIRLLLSDLMWPGTPDLLLQRLLDGSALGIVVRLVASRDANPVEQGFVEVVDSESGEKLDVFFDGQARRIYDDAYADHERAWREACRKYAVPFVTMNAEHFLAAPALDELIRIGLVQAV